MAALSELIAILEDEAQLGETLLLNLTAQKEAILAWDSTALLSQVEKKEHLVRLLREMEEQRQQLVRRLLHESGFSVAQGDLTLKTLLSHLPPTPQTAALEHLQRRTWRIYSRLRDGEKYLTNLMGVLLTHMSEALDSLAPPPPTIALYGGTGALAVVRPEPGIVREKV